MKKHLTPGQWVCLLMAALFLVLAPVAYLTDTLTSESSSMLIGKHKTGVGALNEATPASQTFTADGAGLSAVEVMISTYNKKPKEGTLTLYLTDAGGAELARQSYPVSDLKNNAFVTLTLNAPDAGSSGKTYTLYTLSDCTDQKGVTLRMGPITRPEVSGALTLADGSADTENALNLRMVYAGKTYGWMAGMTCLLVGLCFAACVPLAARKERAHA
jgi:hypothetical protein